MHKYQQWAILLLLCLVSLTAYKATHPPALTLLVELSCDSPNSFQVFYDTGASYDVKDSYLAFARATTHDSFQTIRIPLPHKPILHLRMDPADTEGTFRFRRVAILRGNVERLSFPPSHLVPANQIAGKTIEKNITVFTTTNRATDPQIELTLDRPFSTAKIKGKEIIPFVLIGEGICWALLALAFRKQDLLLRIGTQAASAAKGLHRQAEKIASQLSLPGFLAFDAVSIWFYAACLLCFFIGTAASLNSSASGVYSSFLHVAPAQHELVGEPHNIRSDEWAFETPIILNQVLKAKPFQVADSFPGNHDVSLIANAPLWHYTTLFRPQFWAFFLIKMEYAYAWYWQFKALLLLTGTYTLLLFLMQNSVWAGVGSLWYFFSPNTQWTYSWPSALPEMTGLVCLATVLGCYLTVERRPLQLAFAALLFISCSINLAMCAYLPHLIPLCWLSVLVFLAWLFVGRRSIWQRTAVLPRTVTLGLTILIVGLVGWNLYQELHTAITAISNTEYPGVRRFAGHSLGLEVFASHFFAWTESDAHFPVKLGNICESAGFLWLAPATLFAMKRFGLSRWQRVFLLALWLHFLLLLFWLVLPFPTSVGHLFGLDVTGYTRLLPALGLTNVAIVSLCMSAAPAIVLEQRNWNLRKLLPGASFLGLLLLVFTLLYMANQLFAEVFSWTEVSLCSLITTLFVLLVLKRREVLLATALIIPQAVLSGGVNPVHSGLTSITQSPFYSFVQHHPEVKKGSWLVYSPAFFLSGFLTTAGCDVYSGIKYLPDLDHFQLLQSAGLSVTALNRDAAVTATPVPPQTKPSIEVPAPYAMVWHISPADPLLRKLGIKYLAFDQKPPDDALAAMVPLTTEPQAGLWLYKIK